MNKMAKQVLDEHYAEGIRQGKEASKGPIIVPELSIEEGIEAQVAVGLKEIYLDIPDHAIGASGFPKGRIPVLTRLAYWYSLRNEVIKRLEDMGIKDDQVIADYPLSVLISALIEKYNVSL